MRSGHRSGMNQDNEQEQDSERPFIRWIPIVVPLSGLVLVLGVYLIAAEVLTRVV